jgi:hypothetical protein
MNPDTLSIPENPHAIFDASYHIGHVGGCSTPMACHLNIMQMFHHNAKLDDPNHIGIPAVPTYDQYLGNPVRSN